MPCPIRLVLLVVVLVGTHAHTSVKAQSHAADDPMLRSLVGSWTGTCTIGERTHPSDATYAWTLGGAFLEGTLSVWRDGSRRSMLFERRELLRAAGEGLIAVHLFDSREYAAWGELSGSGTSHALALDCSDGRRIAGLFTWRAADAFDCTLTMSGDRADEIEVTTITLRRRP